MALVITREANDRYIINTPSGELIIDIYKNDSGTRKISFVCPDSFKIQQIKHGKPTPHSERAKK